MKTIQGWLKMGAGWLLLGLAISLAGTAAQGQEEKKEGFYNVEELKRLLEVARESGFTEKEMREITIEDGDKVINVWDFLKELERKKRERAAKTKAQQEKVYLTVQDVIDEMEKDLPMDLSKLRDKISTSE
ncbi:MAG: hypothetical protein O7A08_00930 [SAR324 cluster bacterium]|nr:hypothetical protein [SAR324 cluster bacterium]MCZ6557037.1 hypothetical protein [SAR324 cluster bacterium]MCZ6627273.1 hypothetical protein [SAR324 cluster bacterium]MCZ6647130.1 hypothetical protein [SAR324 cluster bacterium]MCZ6841759.1 hypothetical protein [SAR324 cluster bacterium]